MGVIRPPFDGEQQKRNFQERTFWTVSQSWHPMPSGRSHLAE
jgi:hypothetical protein